MASSEECEDFLSCYSYDCLQLMIILLGDQVNRQMEVTSTQHFSIPSPPVSNTLAFQPQHAAMGVLGVSLAFMICGAAATFQPASPPPETNKRKPEPNNLPSTAAPPAPAQVTVTPQPSVHEALTFTITTSPEAAKPKASSPKTNPAKRSQNGQIVTIESAGGSIILLPYPEESRIQGKTVVMIIAQPLASLYGSQEFNDGLELARWSRQLIEGVLNAYNASKDLDGNDEEWRRRGGLPSLYTLLGLDPASGVVIHDQEALDKALRIVEDRNASKT